MKIITEAIDTTWHKKSFSKKCSMRPWWLDTYLTSPSPVMIEEQGVHPPSAALMSHAIMWVATHWRKATTRGEDPVMSARPSMRKVCSSPRPCGCGGCPAAVVLSKSAEKGRRRIWDRVWQGRQHGSTTGICRRGRRPRSPKQSHGM
jgi:hypothetical protein